jgi:hypothetical protein
MARAAKRPRRSWGCPRGPLAAPLPAVALPPAAAPASVALPAQLDDSQSVAGVRNAGKVQLAQPGQVSKRSRHTSALPNPERAPPERRASARRWRNAGRCRARLHRETLRRSAARLAATHGSSHLCFRTNRYGAARADNQPISPYDLANRARFAWLCSYTARSKNVGWRVPASTNNAELRSSSSRIS